MRKNLIFTLLFFGIFYLLLSGCASNQAVGVKHNPFSPPVVQLLQQFPAQSPLQQRLLVETLANQPADSLRKMMSLFTSNDSLLGTKIRFALHGLALDFQQLNEPQKKKMIILFNEALHTSPHFQQQQFLIEQIQWTADDRFAPLLIPFYTKAELQQPVLRSLRQLKGPYGDATVLPLLQTSPNPELIELCAEHQIKQSIPLLKKLIRTYNESVKRSTLLALARFADPSVLGEVKKDATLSLSFTRALMAGNQSRQAAPLISYWLNKADSSECPELTDFLTLQYELEPSAALTLAVEYFLKKPACRSAILFSTKNWNDSLVANAFTPVLKTTNEPAIVQLINWWAQSKNQFALSGLISHLKTTRSPEVRRTLLQALSHFDQPSLIQILLNEILSHPQNTEFVLQALIRFSKENFEAPFAEILPQVADSVKPELIRFAARHQLKANLPFVLSSLQNEDFEIRQSAWKATVSLAEKTELDSLFQLAMAIQDEQTWKTASRALSELVKSQNLWRAFHPLMKNGWTTSDAEGKIKILEISRRIGGRDFFEFVTLATNDASPQVRQAGRETLLKWPDDAALDDLIIFIKKSKDKKQKILALRQAVRLIQQSGMAAERAFPYLKKLLSLTNRPDEKRLCVASLGDFPSFESIQFLSKLTNDRRLGQTAFNALQRIFQEQINNEDEETQEFLLALIAGKAAPDVVQAIQELRHLNQPPEGFTALFNGKDLSGWQAVAANPVQKRTWPAQKVDSLQRAADAEMRKHWQVKNGILMFDGQGYLSLQTKRTFRNFEMLIDWKIEKNGDSGIYLRGCPQVQIWDPSQWQIGSGGLYNNQQHPSQPLTIADRPTGQWNRFRIIMKGDRVTVYLNNVLVVNNVVLENYWEREKPVYSEGPIELQAHNSPLYFKNIFIRELPDEPELYKGPLFNGQNLDSWQVVGNTPDSWGVKNGVLFTTGKGGGWLSTTREFSDFKLSLEFRVPAGGNSGVFIRAPHEGDPAYTGMEIQVLDDYAQQYAKLKPWQYTGSIYGVQAPSKRVTKPAGQWQKMVITCLGPEVKVELNGQLINQANVINYMHLEKTHPGLKRRKGFIGLQNHTDRVEYRNIFIEELKP